MIDTFRSRINETIAARLAQPVDAVAHERQRLAILFTVAILKLLNFIGGAWDIQWHVEIGRDSLWIPPHQLVFIAFIGGLVLVLIMIAYETSLGRSGQEIAHTARLGPLQAPHAYFGIFAGYLFALLSAVFDELWHRMFGIDATLWSPPHLLIMVSTMLVDFSLLLGISASARKLGYTIGWKSPLLWGILIAGAYAYEAVHFQMGEAFIVGYRLGGQGLYGLLFPLLIGVFLPFSMLACIHLARRFWVVLLTFGLALLLQYIATGIAAAGFAILRPVSVIEEYILLNPDSTAAMSREFAALIGSNGLIGFHQAWSMTLAAPALILVAGLDFLPWMRRHTWLVAPVFAGSMLLTSYVWFQFTPVLSDYPITPGNLLLALVIAMTGGTISGSLGLRLARIVEPNSYVSRETQE